MDDFSYLGFGLGLRVQHYQTILQQLPAIDWFEIVAENYMDGEARPNYYLQQVAEHYPLVMHGVGLSIGSMDPLNQNYLQKLKNLAGQMNVRWLSDHLCWTGVNHVNMHDLLPLPYTEEALSHVVSRIQQVQDYLQRQILLENVSSYVSFNHSTLTEWEFLAEVARRADCYILLDVNNVYVSSCNHNFNPQQYLQAIPVDRVKQFHLAGHTNCEHYLIDTHDHDIIADVWHLYEHACRRFPLASTLIERDDHIPPIADLMQELQQAKTIHKQVTQESITEIA